MSVATDIANAIGVRVQRPALPNCSASGWGLTEGCTDGQGHCWCPKCRRWADVKPLAGHAVRLLAHPEGRS